MTYYNDITNNFPGGLFKCIRDVELFDERLFEDEFFLQIARSFPFMKESILHNREPQKNDNYVELFLINTEISLFNNFHLHVAYDSLERVTDNFIKDLTRFNCSKIHYLLLHNKPRFFLHLKDYFSHGEIP